MPAVTIFANPRRVRDVSFLGTSHGWIANFHSDKAFAWAKAHHRPAGAHGMWFHDELIMDHHGLGAFITALTKAGFTTDAFDTNPRAAREYAIAQPWDANTVKVAAIGTWAVISRKKVPAGGFVFRLQSPGTAQVGRLMNRDTALFGVYGDWARAGSAGAAPFEKNPATLSLSYSRAKKNPPARRGRVMSHRVVEVRYVHAGDGKAYKHTFQSGVCLEALPDGTLRLYSSRRKPLWSDFK